MLIIDLPEYKNLTNKQRMYLKDCEFVYTKQLYNRVYKVKCKEKQYIFVNWKTVEILFVLGLINQKEYNTAKKIRDMMM